MSALWSAIEQNDSRFSIIFISYFYEKDGGRWETYCLYGVEGDGILSILWNFGFESIRGFPVNGLWSYLIKGQGWNIKIDINQSFADQFCWNFVCSPCFRPPFALANFQLCCKGQRLKGRKVKRPNFQKFSEAISTKSKVGHNVFMSIFKLIGPISQNFALELVV